MPTISARDWTELANWVINTVPDVLQSVCDYRSTPAAQPCPAFILPSTDINLLMKLGIALFASDAGTMLIEDANGTGLLGAGIFVVSFPSWTVGPWPANLTGRSGPWSTPLV